MMSQTAGTSSSGNSFSEIVHNENRVFVVKCGPIQPSLNFPQTQQGQRKYRLKKNGTKNSTGWNIWRFRTITNLGGGVETRAENLIEFYSSSSSSSTKISFFEFKFELCR